MRLGGPHRLRDRCRVFDLRYGMDSSFALDFSTGMHTRADVANVSHSVYVMEESRLSRRGGALDGALDVW